MADPGIERTRAALLARAQWLRRLALRAAVVGAATMLIGWIVFWPGAGFDQGLPGLVMLPPGLTHAAAGWTTPKTMPLAIWQIHVLEWVGWSVLAGTIAYRFGARWLIPAESGPTPHRWSKRKIVGLFILFITHLWPLLIVYWLFRKYSNPNEREKLALGETTRAELSQGWRGPRIRYVLLYLTIVWGFALNSEPHVMFMDSNFHPDAVTVWQPGKGEPIRLEPTTTEGSVSPAMTADQLAWVEAQYQRIAGSDAGVAAALNRYHGTWVPADELGRRRLGSLARSVWSDLSDQTRTGLLPLHPEVEAAAHIDWWRWGLTLAGLVLMVLAGLLLRLGNLRERFLDEHPAISTRHRIRTLSGRLHRIEAQAA